MSLCWLSLPPVSCPSRRCYPHGRAFAVLHPVSCRVPQCPGRLVISSILGPFRIILLATLHRLITGSRPSETVHARATLAPQAPGRACHERPHSRTRILRRQLKGGLVGYIRARRRTGGHARPHPGPQTPCTRVWRQILRNCRLSARYVAAFRYFPEDISTETEPAL